MSADWLGALKPVAEALVQPPTPALVLALAGAWVMRRRPRTGALAVVLACVVLWLSTCNGAASWVERRFLAEPAPLDAGQRAQLQARAAAGALAIVVLGGGMERVADDPEAAGLTAASLARLRYAVWLSRQTGIPVAASGGYGWAGGNGDGPTEAARMAQVAQGEFGMPLRWTETASRDTHENAVNTVALLRAAGVREIVLVTHGVHMPRALREFRAA
ncbi:MAG: YdcF family protein, partial [Betaproteobacteria bacterium]